MIASLEKAESDRAKGDASMTLGAWRRRRRTGSGDSEESGGGGVGHRRRAVAGGRPCTTEPGCTKKMVV